MVAAFIITVIGLPLSIGLEFSNNNQWLLYFQLYPHLILFSLLGFGVVIISLYQATTLITKKHRFIQSFLIMAAISLLLTYLEVTSNNMMLLELTNQAQSIITLPRKTIEQIHEIPDSVIDTNKIIKGNNITIRKATIEQTLKNFRKQKDTLTEQQKQGYHTFMKNSLSYSTWQGKDNVFSRSRIFYILSFFIITTLSLTSWILLFMFSRQETRYFEKYLNLLTLAFLVFIAWIPLRFYYNLNTLNLIFGYSNPIGHFDVFAFLIYPIYCFFLCRKIYQYNQDWTKIGLITTIATIITIIGRFSPQSINDLFGLNSNLTIWITFLIPSLVYYYYQLKIIRNLGGRIEQ
jgi:hypothetical protein